MLIKLYHHKTGGGAEYLTDTFIKWEHDGKKGKEGTFTDNTKYIVRIDGDITKDAELTIKGEEKQEKGKAGAWDLKEGVTNIPDEVYKSLTPEADAWALNLVIEYNKLRYKLKKGGLL